MSAPSALSQKIAEGIRREGPITFFEFMHTALYDPDLGYYASRVPGAGAGYRTSPLLTPAFGRLVGRALHAFWRALGRSDRFTVVEVGGGSGELAISVRSSLPDEMKPHTSWRFVEPFDRIRTLQKELLKGAGLDAEWTASLEEGPEVTGCVVANEVLDNFPVHTFEVADGGVLEIFVDADGDRLISSLEKPSENTTPDLHRIESDLSVGDRFELRPGLDDWCRKVAASLVRGYLLVIDYGDTAPDLWVKRPSGTIMTYRGEVTGVDPLNHPGEVDITAHVDFSRLRQAAQSAGLTPLRTMTQRDFLRELGIDEIDSDVRKAQKVAHDEARHADALSLLSERGRLQALTATGGMGDFLVFTAAKDAPALIFDGASSDC